MSELYSIARRIGSLCVQRIGRNTRVTITPNLILRLPVEFHDVSDIVRIDYMLTALGLKGITLWARHRGLMDHRPRSSGRSHALPGPLSVAVPRVIARELLQMQDSRDAMNQFASKRN